jgi:pimeloyl-ACP methyl ester carboxylesterase
MVWAGGIVLVVVAFLAGFQRSLIYHPLRLDGAACADLADTAGVEVWTNAAGQAIGFRSLPPPGDRRAPLAVLLAHGNAGCALQRAEYIPALRAAAPDRAVSVHLLEYPGYGPRPGSPSQQALLAAADDALAAIPADVPVIIVGESLGSAVAAATAGSHPDRVAGLLLLTPFDSLTNVAAHHYPVLPVRWLLRDRYPSAQWLDGYRGPVAIIAAGRDTVVPPRFGRQLHDGYRGPKLLITAENADHNDLLYLLPESAWAQAFSFLLDRSGS